MSRKQKKIRSIADLPDWFDLNKYSAASTLDSRAWFHQISMRRDLYWAFQTTKPPYSDDTDLRLCKQMELSFEQNCGVFDQLKSSPIQQPSTPVTEDDRFLEDLRNKIAFPDFREGVSPMTISDLRRFERKISPGRKEYSRRWIDGMTDQFSKLTSRRREISCRYPPKEWMDKPIHESFSANLANSDFEVGLARSYGTHTALLINTGLPDSVLCQQFSDWLLSARGVKKRLPTVDFDAWVRYGVLPYIDLTIWGFLENFSIGQEVMADAIYQRSDDDGVIYDSGTLRKHTIKIVNRLLNYFSEGNELSIVSSGSL